MVKILREADEAPVAEVAKKHGASDVTIYAWRKRFGKLEAVDVKRLRQIESENARLKKLLAERDLRYLRSDNGQKFVSRAILKWLTEANIDTAFIDPGKPWLNGMNESFNGKFRDECLNMQWFKNRIDAKILIEDFRRHFNETRPHSSLGNLTPAEFKQRLSTTPIPTEPFPKPEMVRRKPAGHISDGILQTPAWRSFRNRLECFISSGTRSLTFAKAQARQKSAMPWYS
jgi:Integrase core domain/Transposase